MSDKIPFPLTISKEELEKQVLPDTFVTDKDAEEMLLWMMGMVSEPPLAIKKVTVNIANKLNMMMAYLVTLTLSRMQQLSTFLTSAEKILFDDKETVLMDKEVLVDRYDKASKAATANFEFIRKFILQNKESFDSTNQELDKLKSLMLALPMDKLKALMAKLEKGEV